MQKRIQNAGEHSPPAMSRSRRGAALVEAALVLPIFFMAILGIVEFGRGMMVSQLVTNMAREANRQAILDGSTNTDVEAFAKQRLAATLNTDQADITVGISLTKGPASTASGNQLATASRDDLVTIDVSVPFDRVSFFVGRYLSGKTISAEVTMRHE